MVKLFLEDSEASLKYWLVIRASGTEPKIKFYSEVCSEPCASLVEAKACRERLVHAIDATCIWLLDPIGNGLKVK